MSEPQALLPLTEQEFFVLLALANRDGHGYAVMQQAKVLSGGRVKLGPGTLYGALKRMLKQGVVEELEGNERRRVYRLTDLGRKLLGAEARRLDGMLAAARAIKVVPA